MNLTLGSLFAGFGGIDLGFERAGFTATWQVEINPYCRKVLAKHFPNAERFEDVRECGAHNLKPVDVVAGGFPCQDISNAGKRAGIDGERSGLWSEYARIIGELRPRFVLIENVAALLGRGMVRVLCDLTALGYDAEWEVISAADVGAPHLRERVWIVAYPRSEGLSSERHVGQTWAPSTDSACAPSKESSPVAYAKCNRWRARGAHNREYDGSISSAGSEYARTLADASGERRGEARELRYRGSAQRIAGSSEDVPNAYSQQYEGSSYAHKWQASAELSADAYCNHAQRIFSGIFNPQEWQEQGERSAGPCYPGAAGQWAVEPNVGRVAHGIPARVDRLRALGNAVVPQIPELIARRIAEVA